MMLSSRRPTPKPPSRRLSAGSRGFTLIELMVTMTGSLFFTVFVFMLSRDVSRYFQSASRTSDATIAVVSGFERLRTDIARAGYLASPNLARDINRCPRPIPGSAVTAPQQVSTEMTSFPGLQQMALLNIRTNADLTSSALVSYNPVLAPENLTLYGNYTTSEQFPVRSVSTGSPRIVYLEQDSAALARVGIDASTTSAAAKAILETIFPEARLLRIVDETGREQFGIVDSVDYGSSGGSITLDTALTLVDKNASSRLCGIRGNGSGLAVNPVNIIRYAITDVRSDLANHNHLRFLYEGAQLSYEDTRLDLMRYDLGPEVQMSDDAGAIDAKYKEPTGELIAEYAVDLRFGLTVVDNSTTQALKFLPEGDSNLEKYAGDPLGAIAGAQIVPPATVGPHFIRGVQARLTVRQREADRQASVLVDPTSATSDALIRIKVDAGDNYARTRTLRTHIATRNTQNLMWN